MRACRSQKPTRKERRTLRRARQARYAAWSADVQRRFRAALAEFPDDMQRAAVPRMLCGRAAMRDASLASAIPGEFYPVLVLPPAPQTPAPPLTLERIYAAFRPPSFHPEHT